MPNCTFDRQHRRDGGTRTGIELDEVECWHRFDHGPDDDDPSLAWFVDVRIAGQAVPDEPEALLAWLMRQQRTFTAGLRSLAEELAIGLDRGEWPIVRPLHDPPADTSVEVAVSAIRRVDARQLAEVLNETADSWQPILASLDRLSVV